MRPNRACRLRNVVPCRAVGGWPGRFRSSGKELSVPSGFRMPEPVSAGMCGKRGGRRRAACDAGSRCPRASIPGGTLRPARERKTSGTDGFRRERRPSWGGRDVPRQGSDRAGGGTARRRCGKWGCGLCGASFSAETADGRGAGRFRCRSGTIRRSGQKSDPPPGIAKPAGGRMKPGKFIRSPELSGAERCGRIR